MKERLTMLLYSVTNSYLSLWIANSIGVKPLAFLKEKANFFCFIKIFNNSQSFIDAAKCKVVYFFNRVGKLTALSLFDNNTETNACNFSKQQRWKKVKPLLS